MLHVLLCVYTRLNNTRMYRQGTLAILLWVFNMLIAISEAQLYKRSDCLGGRTATGVLATQSLTLCAVNCTATNGEGFSYNAQNKECKIFNETFKSIQPCTGPGIFGKKDVCQTPPSLGAFSGSYTIEHPYMGDNSMAKYRCTNYSDVEPVSHCPISRCNENWTPASLSCSKKDIFDSSNANYKGKITCTERGVTCQRWDSNTPHAPDALKNRTDLHNWCQSGTKSRPWCYTTDPNVVWDYCSVDEMSLCTQPPPVSVPGVSISIEWPCNNASLVARYKCSAVLLSNMAPGNSAICPVARCGLSNYSWSTPAVDCSECYDHTGPFYDGHVTCTWAGITCQRWDSDFPHKPDRHNDRSDLENRCVIDSGDVRPWCYTTDPDTVWDWCPVDRCADLPIIFG